MERSHTIRLPNGAEPLRHCFLRSFQLLYEPLVAVFKEIRLGVVLHVITKEVIGSQDNVPYHSKIVQSLAHIARELK